MQESQKPKAPLDKSKLLQSLKSDLNAAMPMKKMWDMKRREWTNQYNGEKYGNEEAGKSAIVSRDIKKQSEWQHASIIDPFVSDDQIVKCKPITADDELAAKQNEILLNTQFCRKFDRYKFMTKAVKLLDREGTVIIQTGWDYADKKVTMEQEVIAEDEFGNQFITVQEVEQTVVVKNQPTAKVCRNEDIFLDPTCEDDMDKCQFVIYRYETDISTLKKDGRYKNLDKVTKSLGQTSYDYDYRPEDQTRFQFKDDPRRKLIVHEYWGNYDVNDDGIAEPIVCAWVNDTIIRLQDNPYPDGKPPFIVVPFNYVPFHMYGEGNAELIGDNQKIKTAIMRGLIDNMAQSNNGQVGVRKGAIDPVNRKKWLAGKNFEFNGTPGDFWQGSYNPIPASAFDMLGLMNNEIESLTGVKSFSGGINGSSLGNTATGARGALDSTSVRRMNIVRNISENLVKPLLRKWMSYNAEFLEDEEIVRITEQQFVPIRRDDLEGLIDLDLDISTSEDDAARVQQISFLLQTLGNNMDPNITKELMAQILELSRMPAQAKALREYQPQKDPMEEQMKQLQLQNAQLTNMKLQSEIERNRARAGEDEIDRDYKAWKAETEKAKARKINSDADLQDLSFVRKTDGVDLEDKLAELQAKHQQELEKFVLQHRSSLDMKAVEAMQRDKDRTAKNSTK